MLSPFSLSAALKRFTVRMLPRGVEEDAGNRTNVYVIPSARPRVPARSGRSDSYPVPPGP